MTHVTPDAKAKKAAYDATRYAARKAAGLCITCDEPALTPYVSCLGCLVRVASAATREHMRLVYTSQPQVHLDRPEALAYDGPQVAHCRAWHAVTALPWRCPTCGNVVLGETP